MSNILIAHSGLMNDAVVDEADELTTLPASNLLTMQPGELWRTTDLIPYFIIDLGAVKTFDFFGLFNSNALVTTTTWRIRTADTEAGLLSPDYDSGTITMIPTGRNADHGIIKLSADESNRWVRVDITDSTNPDGYVQAGRFYIAKSWVPTVNLSYDWQVMFNDESQHNRSLGQSLFVTPRNRSKSIKVDLNFQAQDELFDNAFHIDRDRGISSDVFVSYDIDDVNRFMDHSIYGVQASLNPVINPHYQIFKKTIEVAELI